MTPLLEVRNISVQFSGGRRAAPLMAVDDVSLAVSPRETVGLVGESGSGKSTLGRVILGLVPATSGTVLFGGADITHAGYRTRRALSAELQVVFQDPYSSLNPTRTVGQTLAEPLRVHGRLGKNEVAERIASILARVGLPAEAAHRYPSQFSGGQRQRIAIARALMISPRLVICDEPVSALDLSVQAQVLNLLRDLQDQFELSYLFIAHDLAVVRHLSNRIVVLYRGRVMEEGDAAAVHGSPAHPYTRALLDAAPVPDPEMQKSRRLHRLAAKIEPRTIQPQADACVFASRCPHATDICWSVRPQLEPTQHDRAVACHHWRALSAVSPPPTLTKVPHT